MPNPQFTKPWHSVPPEQIQWNPSVIEDACIGCGTCVTGCSRLVYRFDFERKKPVVAEPLNCMVGCTTCANTCPANAIAFPPLESVLSLEALAAVRHAIEDDLQLTLRSEPVRLVRRISVNIVDLHLLSIPLSAGTGASTSRAGEY
jgi:CDP-4-dehydro-6-deoxyglucose reductase